MQTYQQHLVQLTLDGVVDEQTSANAASNRHDFELALSRAKRTKEAAESGRDGCCQGGRAARSRRGQPPGGMRRSVVAALAAAVGLAVAGGAQADTFTVLAGDVTLPSAEIPNQPGDIAFPAEISKPPATPDHLTYAELLALWQQAGTAYGVPWELLAAINEVESNFGGNMGPSYAGAVGWMQFMPSTWDRWGADANGDGVADPWNPTDAVFSAARYLAASGAGQDVPGAVWSYNHSEEYVQLVLGLAGEFLANPLRGRALLADVPVVDSGPDLRQELAKAHGRADEIWSRMGEISAELDDSYRDLLVAQQSLGDPTLSDRAFDAARRDVTGLETNQHELEAELSSANDELAAVQEQIAVLEQTILEDQSVLGTSGIEGLIGDPATAKAAGVIDFAIQQLGIPYHWGGNHGVGLDGMIARRSGDPRRVRLLEPARLVVRQGRRHLHRRLHRHSVGARRHGARSHARRRTCAGWRGAAGRLHRRRPHLLQRDRARRSLPRQRSLHPCAAHR